MAENELDCADTTSFPNINIRVTKMITLNVLVLNGLTFLERPCNNKYSSSLANK